MNGPFSNHSIAFRPIASAFKARVMSALVQFGLDRLVLLYWKAKGVRTDYLNLPTLAERFSTIYRERIWVSNLPDESPSGTGSSLHGTTTLRQALPHLLQQLDSTILLDVGCGDFNWMSQVHLPCRYVGIDLVPSVIEKDRLLYNSENVAFEVCDATSNQIPQADTLLCREVIFHLSFADGRKLLKNIKQSRAKYLLCTSDPYRRYNADIPSGAWRELNMQLPPYNFPAPVMSIADGQVDNVHRIVGVWKVASLPAF